MKSEKEEPSGCDTFCQHPYCWYSLPQPHGPNDNKRLKQQQQSKLSDIQDDLPTLKVWNINDDYGLNLEHNKLSPSDHLIKSHSKNQLKELVLGGTPGRPVTSIDKKPLKKVEVQEIFDWEDLKKDWQDTFLISQYYVWCPSRNSLRKSHQNLFTQLNSNSSNSDHLDKVPLNLKDVTEDMFPKTENNITYQNNEEVYNIKYQKPSSPLQWKHRIHIPSFNKTERKKLRLVNPSKKQTSSPILQPMHDYKGKHNSDVLLESGILKNSKISLVDGKDNQSYHSSTLPTKSMYFMDEQMFKKLETMNGTNNTQVNSMRETSYIDKFPQNVVGKKKDSQKKMASISMSNLPPLEIPEKSIQTFNYKLNPLFNVKLGPVAVPATSISKRISPPNSGRVSTLHVTVPSIGSPDRSEATPMLPCHDIKLLPENDLLKEMSEPETNRTINIEGEIAERSSSTLSSDLPERVQKIRLNNNLLHESTFGSWNHEESSPSSTTEEKIPSTELQSNSSNKPLKLNEKKQEIDVINHHSPSPLFPQVIPPNSTPICSPTKESMVPQISEKTLLIDISQTPVGTPIPSVSTPNELWPMVDENQYYTETKTENRTVKVDEAYSNKSVSVQNVEESPAPPPPSPEGRQEIFNYELPATKNLESSLIVVQEDEEQNFEEKEKKH